MNTLSTAKLKSVFSVRFWIFLNSWLAFRSTFSTPFLGVICGTGSIVDSVIKRFLQNTCSGINQLGLPKLLQFEWIGGHSELPGDQSWLVRS